MKIVYPSVRAALASRSVTVRIELDDNANTYTVYLDCPLYLNKTHKLPICYSTEYTEEQILRDSSFLMAMKRMFNLTITSGWTME